MKTIRFVLLSGILLATGCAPQGLRQSQAPVDYRPVQHGIATPEELARIDNERKYNPHANDYDNGRYGSQYRGYGWGWGGYGYGYSGNCWSCGY